VDQPSFTGPTVTRYRRWDVILQDSTGDRPRRHCKIKSNNCGEKDQCSKSELKRPSHLIPQRVVWPTPPLIEAKDVGQRGDYTTSAHVD
jgi:hypothetical protein